MLGKCSFVVSILAALVFSGATALAQQQPTPPGFVSEITVNNVTVDVKVVDAHGAPVPDLRKEDFGLLEDGKNQQITNFLAVIGGQVTASPDGTVVGQPAPRQVVVFFDLYQLIESDKRAVLESLRDQVSAGLPPAETMTIVSFDGTLRVHTPPTASRDKILNALKEVERLPGRGLQHQITLSSYQTNGPQGGMWGGSRSYSGTEYRRTMNEEYWNQMRNIVGRVESAFSATLDRFAVAHGARKVVVLISPGFPRAENVPIYLMRDLFRGVNDAEVRNVGLFDHAAQLASELEYTLYTLDPSGNTMAQVDPATRAQSTFVDVSGALFWRESDRKDNLIKTAELTGGEAIFTTNGGAALADVERLTSSYYSLAFQPDHVGDGKEHQLKVEVVGHPDYQLTYRKSYVDRPPEQREADRTRAALLTGQTENPLGVELVLDKPTSKFRWGAEGMHIYRYNAELRIPYAQLTMLPRGQVVWGEVRVVIVATDPKGNQSDLTHQRVPIEIPAERLDEARQKGYYAYRFTLEVEGGTRTLRIAVDDVLAHTTSAVIADLKL
ncbi:MAG TPA: VWA domain-containing protein [Thermoanaerobaculaceae bacterium]|nr:VWA domain-containing protein [Thermoanaerobaculaceae bacterium]